MRRTIHGLSALLLVTTLVAAPAAAAAWNRAHAARFSTLPGGSSAPEGIEVAPNGDVYVTIFGSATGAGELLVLDRNGRLERQVLVPDASPILLGLAFQPGSGALLVVDFGAAQVIAVDPETGSSTPFVTLPALPHPGGAGLNDLTFDRDGNVYVSDSFQGIVWRTGPGGGVATAWVDDPLLRTTGVPPFGANGLRFDRAGTALLVANTGSDMVVRVPVATGGAAGTPAVFATGINGADGLVVDEDDNVWVAANQADEIVVVDPTGRAIAKLGDFDGIAPDGAARGFLFPASLRLRGHDVLVTNLALDLRDFDPAFTSIDSAWCAEVTRHTIARIRRPR
jgi:streptogramin lyase